MPRSGCEKAPGRGFQKHIGFHRSHPAHKATAPTAFVSFCLGQGEIVEEALKVVDLALAILPSLRPRVDNKCDKNANYDDPELGG